MAIKDKKKCKSHLKDDKLTVYVFTKFLCQIKTKKILIKVVKVNLSTNDKWPPFKWWQ